jgi:hypothetical protein
MTNSKTMKALNDYKAALIAWRTSFNGRLFSDSEKNKHKPNPKAYGLTGSTAEFMAKRIEEEVLK